MPYYYRKTSTIFWHSFSIGIALSGFWIALYPNSLDCLLLDIFPLTAFPYIKIAVFFVPALLLFILVQQVNALLIRNFASDELRQKREEILLRLAESIASRSSVDYLPGDLIEKHAWKSIKLFWNAQ
jgi:hypothetical protein